MVDKATTSKLRVLRPGRNYADRLRSHKIYVDDILVGAVAQEAVLELDIPSGAHIVRAKIDWCRAKPLKINGAPGQTVEVEVSNRWGAFLALWAITFGAGSYLTLQPI